MNKNLGENLERWLSETKSEMQIEKAFNIPSMRGGTSNRPLNQRVVATGNKLNEELELSQDIDDFLGGLDDGSSLDDKTQKELLEVFKKNPTSGCTSLIDMARNSSGFDPTQPFKDDNINKFKVYLKKVATCPLMTVCYADTQHYDRKTSDWKKAINAIVDLYEGIASTEKSKIEKSLVNLADCALSNTKTTQSMSLFTQSTVDTNRDGLCLYVYYSYVEIKADEKKGHTVTQTKFDISRIKLKFYTEYWPTYAEKVMNIHVKSLDSWLDSNNTPDGDDKPNLLCFAGK
ncbi:MAG: hypothetical protein E7214_05890 [Clostridium sp.]|nr:hypothetical protein [Clostridium sp.]